MPAIRRMTRQGSRRAVRVALIIAVGCLVVVLAVVVIRLLGAAPSKSTAQRLTVMQLVITGLGAAAAISGTVLAVSQARSRGKGRSDMLVPKLLRDDRLVNRSPEIRELVAHMENSRIVSCYGPRGAGKSFLLEHLTDVVNGHRAPSGGQPKPKGVTAALYFDLADAMGFAEARAQICRSVLGDPNGTWDDFVLYVKRTYKRRCVVLILDNVNSEGLWRQLGQAAYRYCVLRPEDRLVFGSIENVVLSNLPVAPVQVLGLDLEATEELVTARGVDMSHEELIELHNDSNGLPFYVRLLTAHGRERRHSAAVVDQEVIPELPPETRRLVAYMSLIALVDRRISISELRRCPVANLEEQLWVAENRVLISEIPVSRDRRFKLHDIVRDTALRVLDHEVEAAARLLFERAYGDGKLERAALFAMFTDPEEIEASRLDHLLEHVIRSGIKARNYALLGNLHARASVRPRILHFVSQDEARTDLFCYARASELAGLGHYAEAEEEMLSSSIVRTRWRRDTRSTDLQADLRFLQADLAHLLNRYDEAARMFEELGDWAAATDRRRLQALCVWGHGHVLRHQGRDLERALELLDRAAVLADNAGELFAKAYSVCNANGIKILMNAVPDDQEERLAVIEDALATGSTLDSYLLEVWKTQAQLAWWRGNGQDALDTVEAAIDRALETNDRLLYNLYFERAEFRRFNGEHTAALEDYRRVLEFGGGNRDRNLITNSLLGLVLTEISSNRWLYHRTSEDARASVLRARQTALEADIQITARTADVVAGMIDALDASPGSVRVFLL